MDESKMFDTKLLETVKKLLFLGVSGMNIK